MSDNKFIKHLRGETTRESVLEIKNQNTRASFGKMPQGTSNANDVYSDHRGNATAVLKGTQNWKLNGSSLVLASTVNGNGDDYTSKFDVSGAGLWIDSTYTFPSTGDVLHPVAAVFNPGTKWVLKLCGHGLLSSNKNIGFSLIVKFGTLNIITKNFEVSEQAFQFCHEFVIDYSESLQTLVKASGGSTMKVQLLCSDSTASATIYNGMTVLTCLQRGVDASAVSSSFANVEEVMYSGLLPNDFFNNAEYMTNIRENESVFPMFIRRGDEMVFSGWRTNTYEKEVFVLGAGQTVLQFSESLDDKNVDLYWNGQLLSPQGNWTVSGDEITLLFDAKQDDVIVAILNGTSDVVDYITLTAHNTDPDAHQNINIDCGTMS